MKLIKQRPLLFILLSKGFSQTNISLDWVKATGGTGADIGLLKTENNVLIGFVPDSQRYFDHHHSANDTFDTVNKRELELGTASIAALVYLIDKYGL